MEEKKKRGRKCGGGKRCQTPLSSTSTSATAKVAQFA